MAGTRRCEGCLEPIAPKRRSDARWCSRSCYDYYHYPKPFLDAERSFLMAEQNCRACGKSLQEAKRFDTQFCSHGCRQRAYRTRVSSGFGTLPRKATVAPPGADLLRQGRSLLAQHDYQGATDRLREAISLDAAALGEDHRAVGYEHYELGWALKGLGDLDEARRHFVLALDIAEGSADDAGSISLLSRVRSSLESLDPSPGWQTRFDARWENQQRYIGLKRAKRN